MNHNLIRAMQQPDTQGALRVWPSCCLCGCLCLKKSNISPAQVHFHSDTMSFLSAVESIANQLSLGCTQKDVDQVEINISDKRAKVPLVSSAFFSRTPKPSQPIAKHLVKYLRNTLKSYRVHRNEVSAADLFQDHGKLSLLQLNTIVQGSFLISVPWTATTQSRYQTVQQTLSSMH